MFTLCGTVGLAWNHTEDALRAEPRILAVAAPTQGTGVPCHSSVMVEMAGLKLKLISVTLISDTGPSILGAS